MGGDEKNVPPPPPGGPERREPSRNFLGYFCGRRSWLGLGGASSVRGGVNFFSIRTRNLVLIQFNIENPKHRGSAISIQHQWDRSCQTQNSINRLNLKNQFINENQPSLTPVNYQPNRKKNENAK